MQPTTFAPPFASHADSVPPRSTRSSGFVPALKPHAARAVFAATIVLGLTGDALFFDGMGASAFCVWIGLLALNVVALADRAERPLTCETFGWLTAALAFAFAAVWRNAEFLVFFDVLV